MQTVKVKCVCCPPLWLEKCQTRLCLILLVCLSSFLLRTFFLQGSLSSGDGRRTEYKYLISSKNLLFRIHGQSLTGVYPAIGYSKQWKISLFGSERRLPDPCDLCCVIHLKSYLKVCICEMSQTNSDHTNKIWLQRVNKVRGAERALIVCNQSGFGTMGQFDLKVFT